MRRGWGGGGGEINIYTSGCSGHKLKRCRNETILLTTQGVETNFELNLVYLVCLAFPRSFQSSLKHYVGCIQTGGSRIGTAREIVSQHLNPNF